jgi:hypothetical protein
MWTASRRWAPRRQLAVLCTAQRSAAPGWACQARQRAAAPMEQLRGSPIAVSAAPVHARRRAQQARRALPEHARRRSPGVEQLLGEPPQHPRAAVRQGRAAARAARRRPPPALPAERRADPARRRAHATPRPAQICRTADGYQPHLVSPERGMRSLAAEALAMVERPVRECIADVYNLLITSAR